ncbi:hypothetical protein DACRYDRAFT_20468 [Dacryopinax primogenitus]|uniref:Calcofluor white hypersensitive protein n=1 Tax=Dacryopinax primogenitus (strain DJM 731) TaxID=1858805 RepID=M5G9E5_DACPD|nr:uncharacterized protein DACRYDRAFT_20468 [Dacryopinax primogenitus]EJU04855.1 hypothetical protein DACRYDRAFT_20468 [Dacryopinax primogenitus]
MPQTVSFPGTWIVHAHTLCAASAFLGALAIGIWLHYHKIVKNGVAGWPDEWWPSVSATIGDWYPERSIFQILIALTAAPRFGLLFCCWLVSRAQSPGWANAIVIVGLIRTVSCGGWVYISSTDDHDAHDVLMITYVVLTLPWMLGCIACSPPGKSASGRQRKLIASSFFGMLVPMIYFFIRHKVHHVPGAYTIYSFFEWYLIIADVAFDSRNVLDFRDIEITITQGGPAKTLKGGDVVLQETLQTEILTTETKVISAMSTDEISKLLEPEPALFRATLSFMSDVYLGYVFWSILTSLSVQLFYWSVWALEISGSEVALLSTWSPILLVIPPIRRFASTQPGQGLLLALGCMAGLGAWQFEKVLNRLFAVAAANIIQTAAAAAYWSTSVRDGTNGLQLGLGIIFSVVIKMANHANLPTWPIIDKDQGGIHELATALAALAVVERVLRPVKNPVAQVASRTQRSYLRYMGAVGGMGALFFALHTLVSDAGTLISWTWTGYPIRGPTLLPYGAFVVVAMCAGLALSASRVGALLPRNPLWLFFGAGASYAMYRYRDWVGFAGGLGLATFLMSLLPSFLDMTSVYAPGIAWFLVWTINNLFVLAHVWTVAYAFVPGGIYLRERTDLVLMWMTILLICGGLTLSFGRVQSFDLKSLPFRAVPYVLVTLILLSFGITASRMPTQPPIPYRAGERIITAGIWTVHFGIDLEGRDSQRRLKDLIGGMELDIVGLLETDLNRIVYGNRDLTQVLTEDLGYYIDPGPGPQKHTWGAVLLSKYPILNSSHHLLPSPHGELAPAITATLDVYGTNVHVVVSHDGQEEDVLDRQLQSTELGRLMAEWYPEPTIFLGYVVSKPKADRPAPYKYLVEDGRMNDIDEDDWDRWCQYVLYRGLYRIGYARVSRSTITDTELQVGRFLLPRHGSRIIDAPHDDRYLRINKDVVPDSWKFPAKYGSTGTKGHFYHVFPEGARYYALPEGALV